LAFRLLLNAKRGFDETAITPLMVENLLEMARDTIHEALLKEQHSKVIQRFDTLTRWLPEVWNDEQILYDVGVSYEELGFYETADAIYKRVHHHEGQRGGDWRTALALMRVELALGRGENALNLLGEIPSDQSWKETAKGLLEWAAVDRSPGAEKKIGRWLREIQEGRLSPESIVSVGRWYIDQGAYQKAADFLETALSGKVITGQEGSILAEACCLLGDVLRHLGRSQEAMAQYEKVLRREPWGFLEKWAAYRTLQVGREMGVGERGRPYLERLFQEPEGGLWRRIAEYLDQGMTPVGKKEDASWS
jgi:tetratricopeptide (TPR) repeat protein